MRGPVCFDHVKRSSEQSEKDKTGGLSVHSGLVHHLQKAGVLLGVELERIAVDFRVEGFGTARFFAGHIMRFQGETTLELNPFSLPAVGRVRVLGGRKYFRPTKTHLAIGMCRGDFKDNTDLRRFQTFWGLCRLLRRNNHLCRMA